MKIISNLNFEDIELISNSYNIQYGILEGACRDCGETINKFQLETTENLSFAWWKCPCNKDYRLGKKILIESSEQAYFTLKLIIIGKE